MLPNNNCSTKQKKDTKSLLSKNIYSVENPYLHVCKQNSGGRGAHQLAQIINILLTDYRHTKAKSQILWA